MIEYLFDAIRATAGSDNIIAAKVSDELGNPVTSDVVLRIHLNDGKMIDVIGDPVNDTLYFSIPASVTEGLKGRHSYCVRHLDEQLCFMQPIYFV